MCPDRQILSLFVDGEVPSPWKEKTEAHLASCEACRSRFDRYRRLRSVLRETPEAAFQSSGEDAVKSAQERVWARLESSGTETRSFNGQRPSFSPVKTGMQPGWKRSVSLPLPAAAAAAAVFVIVALFAIRGAIAPVQQGSIDQVSGIGADLQGIVPLSDMASILQYLAVQDSGDYVIIQLPETRNFSSYGEPTLIRAADYSARTDRESRRAGGRERTFSPGGNR